MFSANFTSEALTKTLTAVVKTQITETCLAVGKAIESHVMGHIEKGIPVIEFTIDVPNRTIILGDVKDTVLKVGTSPVVVQKAVLSRIRDELVRRLGPNALNLFVTSGDGSGKFYRYPMPEPAEVAPHPVNGLGHLNGLGQLSCTKCGRTGHTVSTCYATTIVFGVPLPTAPAPPAPPTENFVSEGIKLNLLTFITDI